MEFLSAPQTWIAFATLFLLEVVLGIDNIIFISILSGKLPEAERAKARSMGLALALVTRIILLFSLSWVMGLTNPLFTIPFLDTLIQPAAAGGAHGAVPAGGHGEVIGTPGGISGRDLILLLGGLFLLFKSVHEIHHKLEGEEGSAQKDGGGASFGAIIAQILVLDIVFSLDSVITAVGMVDNIAIMIMAVVAAVGVMLFAAGPISNFVEKHPTLKILALSFLLLIGVTLIAEGLQIHIPKGFIYFAMAFSFGVEMLNLKMRKDGHPPVSLRQP
ncbi:TerC family protein [bacterium]|nr:MAG: TerC family protein [bacterium]